MMSDKLNLLLGALLIAAAIAAVLEHRATGRLREDNLALRERAGRLADVEAEHRRLTNLLAHPGDRPLPDAQLRELLKLRGEITALRQQTNELAQVQSDNARLRSVSNAPPTRNSSQPAANYLPRESWRFAGYADPDAAVQSCFWAWSSGDAEAVMASFTPAHRAGWGYKTDEEVAAQLARNTSALSGFSILDRKSVSDDEVQLTVGDPDAKHKVGLCYKRIGSEWKFDYEFKAQ